MRKGGKNVGLEAGRVDARERRNRWRLRRFAVAMCLGLGGIGPIGGAMPVHAQAVDPFALAGTVDFREQMRTFIQSISAYGHAFNPRFVVVAMDGLELVAKPDPLDDQVQFPARAFMRSIDAVMATDLTNQTVTTPDGKFDPLLQAKVDRRNADIAIAKSQGLTLMSLEFATEPTAIDKLYRDAQAANMVPFVAQSPAMGTVPAHPASAFSANPKSINSLADAENFLFISNTTAYGQVQDLLNDLRNTNHDVVVVDVFHDGKPLTRQDVDVLKYKKLGAKRLVLAQIDIAHAASFNYYWKPGWGPGNPEYISNPVRNDPDRHRVLYWDAAWQGVISGDFNSYVYGVIDLGFDGVVLKGTDAWRFYETGGEE